MSRSGYSDDCDGWELIRWRGAVTSAIRGGRGQAFLCEMLDALDALPDKRLTTGELQTADGDVCALGSVGLKRGADMTQIDPYDADQVASFFGVAQALVREIEAENDEGWGETPEQRWQRMRDWCEHRLKTNIRYAGEK
jgi:hypothetical protein